MNNQGKSLLRLARYASTGIRHFPHARLRSLNPLAEYTAGEMRSLGLLGSALSGLGTISWTFLKNSIEVSSR
jgi:hypothetical protein